MENIWNMYVYNMEIYGVFILYIYIPNKESIIKVIIGTEHQVGPNICNICPRMNNLTCDILTL